MILDNEKKLYNLETIENVDIILNQEELKLLNKVFYELNGFDQMTDELGKAISDNKINHLQLNQILKIITKTVYFKMELNSSSQPKKGIINTFFEIPEIISKKVHLYIYRSKFSKWIKKDGNSEGGA